ncbi:NADH:ubiquinone oxidoreductase subunit N [compost metagenome]
MIGVYYYLRPVVVMYMREGEAQIAGRSLNATTVTAVVMALAIALLGFVSGPIFAAVEKSLI